MNTDDDDKPLYRFSIRRLVVVATALITVPIWGPWVQYILGRQELLLVVPFIIILLISFGFLVYMFPSRSKRRQWRRRHWR